MLGENRKYYVARILFCDVLMPPSNDEFPIDGLNIVMIRRGYALMVPRVRVVVHPSRSVFMYVKYHSTVGIPENPDFYIRNISGSKWHAPVWTCVRAMELGAGVFVVQVVSCGWSARLNTRFTVFHFLNSITINTLMFI